MRDEVYKSYYKKLHGIITDCVVDNSIAEKDPKKYVTYSMKHPANKGVKISYDVEKLQKHKDTLRQIFTEIPQRDFLGLPMVSCNDLFKQSTAKAKDISKLKQQSNAAELFLSMSESVRHLRT